MRVLRGSGYDVRVRETRALGVAVFAGYMLAALGVENLFPISTFPMYSATSPVAGARLVVRDSDGAYAEVVRFDEWSCDVEPTLERVLHATCDDGRIAETLDYLSQEALDHMRAHAGTAGAREPVDLMIRAWRFEADGTLSEHDCPVTACTASR